MAKKKKHRKTRKQKIARANLNKDHSLVTSDTDSRISSVQSESKKVQTTETSTNEDKVSDSVYYVKKDVKSSLILAGVIIAVFGLIYFLLSYTAIGDQIYSIIKL